MNPQTEGAAGASLDLWELVVAASPVVQAVMLLLVFMALACWYVIGKKWVRFGQVSRQSRGFLEMFWADEETRPWDEAAMREIHGRVADFPSSPIAALFRAGHVELARIARTGTPDTADVDNLERALRRAHFAELGRLEAELPILSTTGATAPFIGLFGTVWGIMNAFVAIHGDQTATLDVVAPGIAEALIATALGLAAAIPAVMAYNYFLRRLKVVRTELDMFAADYLNIIRRHLLEE